MTQTNVSDTTTPLYCDGVAKCMTMIPHLHVPHPISQHLKKKAEATAQQQEATTRWQQQTDRRRHEETHSDDDDATKCNSPMHHKK
jgi:hypothetical protein